jgi:hypothetical protein
MDGHGQPTMFWVNAVKTPMLIRLPIPLLRVKKYAGSVLGGNASGTATSKIA